MFFNLIELIIEIVVIAISNFSNPYQVLRVF
jgi:Tfp pilus assembly major pilin PilA